MELAGLRSILRNATLLMSSQAIGVVARFVYVVVVARVLGPELYALLAYSQAWHLAFLPIALFGLGPALAYSVAPDRDNAPAVAATALTIRLVTTIVAATACLAISLIIVPVAMQKTPKKPSSFFKVFCIERLPPYGPHGRQGFHGTAES